MSNTEWLLVINGILLLWIVGLLNICLMYFKLFLKELRCDTSISKTPPPTHLDPRHHDPRVNAKWN